MPHEPTTAPASAPADPLECVLDCVRSGITRIADELRPIDAGLVVRASSLPAVWSLNHVRVSQPLTFEALIQLADEQQAELAYRHIVVEHQATGPELEPAFRAAGWKVERDLLMVVNALPDRPADLGVVVDAGEDEVLELMERWHDDSPVQIPDELAQLVAYSRREIRAQPTRLLGVRGSNGRLAAIAQLRSHGRVGQVEDVYTVPGARGRGSARALVTRAIELARGAGQDPIFIIADDEDWPKLLYERLGFRPAGYLWQFHRG